MRTRAPYRSVALALYGLFCVWLGLSTDVALAQPLSDQERESATDVQESAPLGSTISFGEAWHRVQGENPDMQAFDDLDSAWGHRARQASAYPNPSFTLTAEDFGAREELFGQTQWTFSLSQPIPLGSRLDAGRLVEEQSRAAWKHEAALVGKGLKTRLKTIFVRVFSGRNKLHILQTSTLRFQEVLQVIQARVDAGSLPQVRVQRVRQVLTLEKESVASLERDMAGFVAELPSLWGGNPGEVTAVSGRLSEPRLLPDLRRSLARLADVPEMKGCAARVGKWEAEAELREQEAVPDIGVGAGYRGLDGFDSHGLVLEVSFAIPVLNRNEGAVDEARARKRANEFSCRGILSHLQTQASVQHAQASALQVQFRRIRDVLLPEATAAYEAALEALTRGEVDINDMLGLAEYLVGLEMAAASIQEEYWLAAVGFESLLGEELLSFEEANQ